MTGTPLWTLALEQQFATFRLAQAVNRASDSLRTKYPTLGLEANVTAAMFLPRSEAFAWTAETSEAVLFAAESIPDNAVLDADELPARACWFWFEKPLPSRWIGHIDRSVSAITVARLDNGDIEIIPYAQVPGRGASSPQGEYITVPKSTIGELERSIGRQVPNGGDGDDSSREQCVMVVRFVKAACVWLRQRVVIQTSGHVERHRRKQLAREHGVPMPSEVKVIQLRRAEPGPASNAGADVAWSCRWIVNGFWRNQPYKDGRRLIYINPFIKGPADKPLRVPTHTVYQVSR